MHPSCQREDVINIDSVKAAEFLEFATKLTDFSVKFFNYDQVRSYGMKGGFIQVLLARKLHCIYNVEIIFYVHIVDDEFPWVLVYLLLYTLNPLSENSGTVTKP